MSFFERVYQTVKQIPYGKVASYGDIAAALEMSQTAISHQLRILKQSHLVRCRRDGKQMLYSLADDHVKTILSAGLEHVEE